MKKLFVSAILAAVAFAGTAQALELRCGAPKIFEGDTKPVSNPVTAVHIYLNNLNWGVFFYSADGSSLNRMEQYNSSAVDAREAANWWDNRFIAIGGWRGEHLRKPYLHMAGSIIVDKSGKYFYTETLVDNRLQVGHQRVLLEIAECEAVNVNVPSTTAPNYPSDPTPLPPYAPPAPAAKEVEQSPTPPPKKEEEKFSAGTGFFVTSEGDLVTNAHVIEKCEKILVKTDDGSVLDAHLVAKDVTNDLSLLKIQKSQTHPANIRTSIRLGEQVAAFGYPHIDLLSSSGNFTLGNVTATNGIGDDSRYLQISAPVQAGNSGGPLLDQNGNSVGIVSSKLNALKLAAQDGDLPQNVNFAIKAAILATFLDSNRISFQTAMTTTKPLEPADLADLAKAISGFVVCR